jgi:hypothetical protein
MVCDMMLPNLFNFSQGRIGNSKYSPEKEGQENKAKW